MLRIILIGFVCLMSGCLSPQIDTGVLLMQSFNQKLDGINEKLDRIDILEQKVGLLDQKIRVMESNTNVQVKSPIIVQEPPQVTKESSKKGFFARGLNSEQEDFIRCVLDYLK